MPRVRVVLLAGLAAALVVVPLASALDLVAEPNVLPDGVVGQPYEYDFEGEEGCPPSYHFAFDGGHLPPGLVVDRATGELEGVPTAAGDFDFWVELTDDCGSIPSQGNFQLRILAAYAIETTLNGTIAGRPVTTQLVASGGGTQTWSVTQGALPPGLTLSPQGLLAGVTSALGTYPFTVKVEDSKRSATKAYSYVVASQLQTTSPLAAAGEAGRPFTATPTASGGIPPLRWSVTSGSLPTGVSLNQATGAMTGVPTAAGSFPVTLTVRDVEGASGTVVATLAIAQRLALSARPLPSARVGTAYRARLATSGGVQPFRWRLTGVLPRGLRFDARTGTIVGTPRQAATRRLAVRVTDRFGANSTRRYLLVVRA